MVLSHYENNIWREHFRISRQTFRFVRGLVRPHSSKKRYKYEKSDFIKFPKGEVETRKAIQAFQEISSFSQVVGAIDGSHIPIIAPKNDANDYYNRKQFHSIVLQGVADADVCTGYAGSIHDARVLRMTSLASEVENRTILVSPAIRSGTGEEIRPLLVANPAYKLTNWCMKPYPEIRTITPGQRNSFNKALNRARVVIEQAFGMLKGRWGCLLVKLDESVDKIPLTTITCYILHNICIEVRDDVDVDPEDDHPDELPPLPGHMNRERSRLRNKIKEAIFS